MDLEKAEAEKINYVRLFRICSFLVTVFVLILVFGATTPIDLGVRADPQKANILANMQDRFTNLQLGINSFEGIITSEEATSYIVYNVKDFPLENVQIKFEDELVKLSGTLVKPIRLQLFTSFKIVAQNSKPVFDGIKELQVGYLPIPVFLIEKALENNQDFQRLKSGDAYQSTIKVEEIKIEDNVLKFKLLIPVSVDPASFK
ncbi:MAG: hypothetical protein HY776_01350 [Actinobacteria bacterium]|nr:hypothetical protein [Actinomycetota bacterium]